jgi:hypothetical protein
MHLIFQPGTLAHQLRSTQHLTAQRAGLGIRQPQRGQVIRLATAFAELTLAV